MLKPAGLNEKDNFIAGWYIDEKVCDDLINYFESHSDKGPGVLRWKGANRVIPELKHSTDLSIEPNNQDIEIINYRNELQKVTDLYKQKYVYCDKHHGLWDITNLWNIQKYNPNQGYFLEHFERNAGAPYRHLVFMTYLNDVTDGGETEFFYQKLKVKPEKGLTIIWGADWTFTHKGITSPTQTKYIATGWYEYCEV